MAILPGSLCARFASGCAPHSTQSGACSGCRAYLASAREQLPDAVDKDRQMKPVQYPDDEKPKPIPPPPSSTPGFRSRFDLRRNC